MAFASFGIITPVLSVVLSVFMLGLAAGSWAGGRWISPLVKKTGISAAFFYSGAELLIGLGAFLVPVLFALGERILLTSGEMDSFQYLSLSALVLATSILPWCVCMGATFPFMMAYVREQDSEDSGSFSFLYMANVLGAMTGTLLTALVYIEVFGFHHTLWLAAAGNFTVSFISVCLGWRQRRVAVVTETPGNSPDPLSQPVHNGLMTKLILFSTGFVAMAMEVVWTRAFTPVLKTQVYSFALIVFTYLGATFVGSWKYRRDLRKNRLGPLGRLIAALAITALFPVIINDMHYLNAPFWVEILDPRSAIILLASICPFCALLGYLTPRLIDGYAAGQPAKAGRVYAINVLGCILGPLFACYVLLPRLSERHALILLALPFLFYWPFFLKSQGRLEKCAFAFVLCAAFVWSSVFTMDFETMIFKIAPNTAVRRDYAASVITFGKDMKKYLLVNGIGMTQLNPVTKFMAHLPLAYHQGPPQSILVICFGMGTTYRSALSWNIDTTAVELVPGVTESFGFYHADAGRYINDPKGHIIIDDGRRYLNRCGKKFDVIVVDPPPPITATGSSLLFSTDFYTVAKQHLNHNGILQMWFPGGERLTWEAVVRSFNESFPYVHCFPSAEGWGIHMLGSMEPIEHLNAAQLTARMPDNAKKDLLEWYPTNDASIYLAKVVTNEYPVPSFLNPDLDVQITDDNPFNEYFLLRSYIVK
jgi:spermidine synthase